MTFYVVQARFSFMDVQGNSRNMKSVVGNTLGNAVGVMPVFDNEQEAREFSGGRFTVVEMHDATDEPIRLPNRGDDIIRQIRKDREHEIEVN